MEIGFHNITKAILSFMMFNVILFANSFSYEKYPSIVYEEQIFPITIKSDSSMNDHTEFIFDIDGGMQPISDKPIIKNIGDSKQYRFFFKGSQNKVFTPKISILHDGKIETLDGINIKTKKLPFNSKFSGIIAKNLIVKTYQVSKYDKTKNIIMLSLIAIDGNAKDMHLDLSIKEASENIVQEYDKQSCNYYAVIDSSVKSIYFTYYNTIENKFIDTTISATVKDSTVAAQSNLNPDFDQFEKLKKIIYGVVFILAIIVFIKRRKMIYIAIGLLFLTFLIISNLPRKSICIQQGTEIYVLPVGISKTSETIDTNISTANLGEQNGFVKIAYKSNKIGWVKIENICKD